MCRTAGRRCNNVHTGYGRAKQNLKAKEQYTKRKLKDTNLPVEYREKLLSRLQETQKEIERLEQKYQQYPNGKHYHMDLTEKSVKVLNQLKADNLTPYVVGGSVRDALLNLNNKDVDIEVYGGRGFPSYCFSP